MVHSGTIYSRKHYWYHRGVVKIGERHEGGAAGREALPAPPDSSPARARVAHPSPQAPGGAHVAAGEGAHPDQGGRPAGGSPASASIAPPDSQSVGFTLSSLGYAVAARFRATLAPLELEPREFALL